MTLVLVARVASAALLVPATLGAQSGVGPPHGAERGAFVVLRGADTLAVERFVRTARAGGDSTTAELLLRGGPRVRHTLVDSAGLVPRYLTEAFAPGAPPEARPVQRAALRFTPDSVFADVSGAPAQRIAVRPGTLPWVNPSFVLVEQLVRRARVLGGARAEIPMVNVAGAAQFVARVEAVGRDSAVVRFPDVEMRVAVDRAGRVTGARVPAQNLTVVRVATPAVGPGAPAPGAATAAPRASDYAAPPGAPYATGDVTVRAADGARLAGTFTRPVPARRGARVPAVLLLSGSGPQDRDGAMPVVPGYRPFRELADTLGRRGVAVLRLDDRGVGRSGGARAGVTIATLADDARAALAWLRARPDVDAARLALLGHSEGALVAPIVAADDPALAAVVLLGAPASVGRETSIGQQRRAIERLTPSATPAVRESLFVRNLAAADSLAARSPYLRFWFAYDPLPTARRLRQPVLILQGETDTQVTPDEAPKLAAAVRAGGNHDVTVRVFPATNHLFLADPAGEAGPGASAYAALPSKHVRPQVLGAAADWLAETLR